MEAQLDLMPVELDRGAPPLDLSQFGPADGWAIMRAPAGWASGWHTSSARNLFFILSGEWEVTTSDGETRRFAAGAVLLVSDTTGKGHTSRVIGDQDSLSAVIQLPNS